MGHTRFMDNVTTTEWRQLLRLLLAQRLELNAIESALKNARVLTDGQLKEIRQQASDTAKAWSSKDSDDVLALLGVHSLPAATMLVPQTQEELRRRFEGESDRPR
jgi:hypothetical protein